MAGTPHAGARRESIGSVLYFVGSVNTFFKRLTMSQKQTTRYCLHCRERVMAVGQKPNHVLHLILTCLTAGLWGVVWCCVAAGKIGGYRCSRCGSGL